jgi:hypothetical protein
MSIQIPNLHTSNKTRSVVRKATVFIRRRKAGVLSGEFTVSGTLQFNPVTDAYPSGNLTIKVDLTDSETAEFKTTSIEQLDTTGRDTPTVYASGRCLADIKQKGCRYWIMLVDNKRPNEEGVPDVISFLIFDRTGKRVAYGTGPVLKGDVTNAPTAE